jgi:predicted transcriptional regulator
MGRKMKSITQRQEQVLSARVNVELYGQVEALAAKEDLSMTQIVRAALRTFVKERMDRSQKKAVV